MSDTRPPAPPAPAEPHGELVIRTIAMPADANANGDIFGGWLLSQMDLGGAIYARNLARSRVTTVAIDAMTFITPVYVGDIVSCHATLLKVGRTSMRIAVEAWAQRTKGVFVREIVAHEERARGPGDMAGPADAPAFVCREHQELNDFAPVADEHAGNASHRVDRRRNHGLDHEPVGVSVVQRNAGGLGLRE